MNSAAPIVMTVNDLYALPDDGLKHELVHGWLVSEPLPGVRHGRIAARLVQRLGAFVDEHRLGVVLTCDTGFVLHRKPDTVRGPDVAFVRRDRYDAIDNLTAAFPGPPDIAVEVLSPSDSATSIHGKVADFLAAGTPLVWVVDPNLLQVRCYRSLLEPHILTDVDALTADDLLPRFRLPVQDLFAD